MEKTITIPVVGMSCEHCVRAVKGALETQKGVKAVEVGKYSNVISVTYRDTNPEQARNVVNALVQAYLEQSVGFKTEEASRTVSFVENQLQGLRNELDGAEKNLQNYKSSTGVVELDSTAKELISKLSGTERELAEIAIRRKGVEFALASLKEARRRGVNRRPVLSAAPELTPPP